MVALIRQWIIYKELVSMAMLENFTGSAPEKVLGVLERFALSRVGGHDQATKPYAALVFSRKELLNAPHHKRALLKIWELSKERYQNDLANRSEWHRVMACCNALYERYTSMQDQEVQLTDLAA